MTNHIPVIIPSYEPDENLLKTIRGLLSANSDQSLIIINDGSGPKYDTIFSQAERLLDNQNHGVVLKHTQNMGKGRALKTGFSYALKNDDHLIGCVTADSDVSILPKILRKLRKLYGNTRIPWFSGCGTFPPIIFRGKAVSATS